jgi:hypothetical protein
MSCCSKTKEVVTKTKHIAVGFVRLARGTKYEFTDDRVRACRECPDNYWLGRSLWCRICKCFVPAKARVKEEMCPLGKWLA